MVGALKTTGGGQFQLILVSNHKCIYIDSDPEPLFDKVLWTDGYDIEQNELAEALIAYCGTLAYYNKEGIEYIDGLVREAREEGKKIIDLAAL